MQQSFRAAVLLLCVCSFAQGRRVLVATIQQSLNSTNSTAGSIQCSEEARSVLCGVRAQRRDAIDRAFGERCCTAMDMKLFTANNDTYNASAAALYSGVEQQRNDDSSSSSLPQQDRSPLTLLAEAAVGSAEGGDSLVQQFVRERSSTATYTQETEETLRALRPDLDPTGPLNEFEPNDYYEPCTKMVPVSIPSFPGGNGFQVKQQLVPARLTRPIIRQTKAFAINQLRNTNFKGYGPLAHNMTARDSLKVQRTYYDLRGVNPVSGFVHPGCIVGPAELALMKERLAGEVDLQELALKTLLTGSGVEPKVMRQWIGPELVSWSVPLDTPLKYAGPFPMRAVDTKYNGIVVNSSDCPENYPAGAPRNNCGHVALVELDAQQAYKQALAYWATGRENYAKTALNIIEAWATKNQKFGLAWENGPLEAGWAVASFARALELLRGRVDGWDKTYEMFDSWQDRLLMPLMDYYVNTTEQAIKQGKPNVLGNWHTTIAEAWMAVGILTDDRPRYNKAIELYHATVKDYFKWGRGKFQNYLGVRRFIGEATETLRDIYHTQFAMGGMLQTAEMAWQQDEDLYSSAGYALAAAMEMQAAIILAHNETDNTSDESALPPGFKLSGSMPPAPANTTWKFDFQKQLWSAVNNTNGAWVSDLKDGVKYVIGNGYLPAGWELGYNHYVGRLGMQLPQTTALLQRHNIDWYAMHFGLGTISHANTAALLWRIGLKKVNVCRGRQTVRVNWPKDATPTSPKPS